MKCLITGASSGIGKDIAKVFSNRGYETILVSKGKERLENASKEIKNSKIYIADLTKDEDIDKLIEFIKKEKPDIVANNAGFGHFGFYDEINTNLELDMIKVNVIALERITKACLEYMIENKDYYILNTASLAGLMMGGPLLSTYYATKSYVRSYTLGLYKELQVKNKNIHISVLCPGPVDTNFNNVAGGSFSVKPLTSEYVAKYAVDNLFKDKLIIIPGFFNKVSYHLGKFLRTKTMLNFAYKIQENKRK